MTISSIPEFPAIGDAAFNSKAYAYATHMAGTFRTEINALEAAVNADEAATAASAAAAALSQSAAAASASVALAAANFKGAWSTLTGALAIPASVSHNGGVWILAASVADVTAHTPGVSASWVSFKAYVLVADKKASGTGGGTSLASDITQTRTLNTVTLNTVAGASLASNKVTLPAGTYEFFAVAPYYALNCIGKLFLYNVTDAAYVESGPAWRASSAYINGAVSFVSGVVTITSPKEFSLRHWTSEAGALTGLGSPAATGQQETFAMLQFSRV